MKINYKSEIMKGALAGVGAITVTALIRSFFNNNGGGSV